MVISSILAAGLGTMIGLWIGIAVRERSCKYCERCIFCGRGYDDVEWKFGKLRSQSLTSWKMFLHDQFRGGQG